MLFTREQVTYDRFYHARTTINTEAVTLIETVYTPGQVFYLGTSEGTDCATISTFTDTWVSSHVSVEGSVLPT